MGFYERMGVPTLINASETYTNLGGSLMRPEVFQAIREAGEHFIDFHVLLDKVCEKAADLTNNEAAFITTGAAGGVILSAAACMCRGNEDALECIPDRANTLEKNEILIYNGPFKESIPYWKLIRMTGAKIISVEPNVVAMERAATERTAAVFLFPSSLYEKEIPLCEETIPRIKQRGVPVVVDAAAQLPPVTNLWYYTQVLGADLAIFSGGKHIRGPQSTGLIVGKKELLDICGKAASPNPQVGRGFKTGKEELAGFITALELFVRDNQEACYQEQEEMLLRVEAYVAGSPGIRTEIKKEGRLGTYQPLLLILLPEGVTGERCNQFMRNSIPAIDIGVYQPEFNMPENSIFVNAYNLRAGEERIVGEALKKFLETIRELSCSI